MLSVNLTTYRSILLVFVLFSFSALQAQENSPFSRYGLGDLYPQQTVAARGMGGTVAGFNNSQAINTANPASYGNIHIVTFDVGVSIDQRTLKSASPKQTYSSANFMPAYVLLGTPLSAAHGWGFSFGMRPLSRINYSIETRTRNSVDSLQTLYQGTGGLTQGFIGIGKTWGKPGETSFSLGFNTGMEFGRKEISTIINYVNDTVAYSKSNFTSTATYKGFFFNPGVMLGLKLSEKLDKITKVRETYMLNLGASATLKHNLTASLNSVVETFDYDANGAIIPIDTIKLQTSLPGKINMPLTYTAGFMLSKLLPAFNINKWAIGADYSAGQWNDYRYYGQADQVMNNWMLHAGGEFTPDPFALGLFNRATYRAGFYTGKDYINADGNEYNVKAFTLGMGFALKKFRGQYDHQFTMINTAIEFGKRGDTKNNVTENFFKFSVGFSLSDIWFIKRKYD